MIQSILFDLDGVLCEAQDWHYESLNRALDKIVGYKISREDHEATFNGIPTRVKLDILTKKGIVAPEQHDEIWILKQNLTVDVINDLAKVLPEKQEMHFKLKELGIKIACVTNSIRKTAQLMLRNTGQLDFMDLVISNEDVRFPKPSPEGYINAMVDFGTRPEISLAVEDSDKGYAAALASTAHIWRVKNSTEVTCDNLQIKLTGLS